MSYTIENDCVGCPQGCIHCNRFYDYKAYYCDTCGEYFDADQTIYIDEDGSDICEDCYLDKFNQKICDDMDDDICSECGLEADTLYWYNGAWHCRECVLDDAKKARY